MFLGLLEQALRPGTQCVIRYGLFAARATNAQRQTVEAYSWTSQRNADAPALAALGRAFVAEGRDALFYLGAPELAATLPTNARMIPKAPDLMTEAAIAAARRHGRIKGHIYVLVNNALPVAKVAAILRAFADYDPAGWSKTAYANATIYRQ